MLFARPLKHFVCYIQAPHKSKMLDAGWHQKTQDFGKSLWVCIGGGKGTKFVYLFNLEMWHLRCYYFLCFNCCAFELNCIFVFWLKYELYCPNIKQ